MTTQHFDTIEINNIAVQNLEYNNFSSACKLLTPAVKSILANYSAPTTSCSIDCWKYTRFEWSKTTNDQILKSKSSKSNANNSFSDSTIGSFLFSRAMYIRDLRPVRHPNQVLSSDIKAALIYNAGLAFQLQAIKQNNDFTLLSKARDMYRLSQAILRDANQKKKSSSKLLHKHYFHVALLNNLGQICYEFVEYAESRHYFQNVEANLLHIMSRESKRMKKNPSRKSQKNHQPFHAADMFGMMSNTLVDIPNAAPCA